MTEDKGFVFHRDKGFDGQYRDNFLVITGERFRVGNIEYYPVTMYGLQQRDKVTHEIKHDTFDINKGVSHWTNGRQAAYQATGVKFEPATMCDKCGSHPVNKERESLCKKCQYENPEQEQ